MSEKHEAKFILEGGEVVEVRAVASGAGWKVRRRDADGKFEAGVEDWTPLAPYDTEQEALEAAGRDGYSGV
jgi:hypothetical protein